jgi:hypothetical protein
MILREYKDAMQRGSATASQIDAIVTRNPKNYS